MTTITTITTIATIAAPTATLPRPQRRRTRQCATCQGYGYRIASRWDARHAHEANVHREPCPACGGTGRELTRHTQKASKTACLS